jgi:putative addiction module component (TIGR02574 family)
MMKPEDLLEEIRRLGPEDRVRLLDALWAEMVPLANERALSKAEENFLDRRLQAIREDPRPDVPWNEAMELLRAKK